MFKKNNKVGVKTDSISKRIIIDIQDGKIVNKIDKIDQDFIFMCLKKKYRDTLEDYKFAFDNINTKFIIEKKKQEEYLLNKEQELKSKYECNICMENSKNVVLVPCGHSFCEKCSNNIDNNICYICRTKINFKQKIY